MRACFRRIGAIAATTFLELARLRVFYVLVLFGLVLILSSSFLARISFQQELQVTKDIALGAINFFLSLLAVVATAQLLPRDIEDRVVYSVLAKPVRRFEYTTGKFLGVLGLLVVSLLAMSLLCIGVIHFRQQAALHMVATQFAQSSGDDRANALRSISEAGVNSSLVLALVVMLGKGAVLAAATLAISTFATSTIFTITAMAMVYVIGHLEPIAREYWLQYRAGGWLMRSFLAVVTFVFPDLQAFNVSDQIISGGVLAAGTAFKLVELGGVYTASYLLLAIAIFYGREL